MNTVDPESPLAHLVANLQHLKGKSLGELVRLARYRRKRPLAAMITPDSDEKLLQGLKQFLSEHPNTAMRDFNDALVKGVAS